jgi:hypothetical protein
MGTLLAAIVLLEHIQILKDQQSVRHVPLVHTDHLLV